MTIAGRDAERLVTDEVIEHAYQVQWLNTESRYAARLTRSSVRAALAAVAPDIAAAARQDAEPFDWQGWVDGEREATERRVGSVDTDRVLADVRYNRVLRVHARAAAARAALAAAEAAAQAMTGGGDAISGQAAVGVPAGAVPSPGVLAAIATAQDEAVPVLGEEAREAMRQWLAGYAPLYEHETAEIADGLLTALTPHVAALLAAARRCPACGATGVCQTCGKPL